MLNLNKIVMTVCKSEYCCMSVWPNMKYEYKMNEWISKYNLNN